MIKIRHLRVNVEILIVFAEFIRPMKIIRSVGSRFRMALIHFDFFRNKMASRAIYIHVYAIWISKFRWIERNSFYSYNKNW